jgi:DNA-binding NarL/FixJ family response regulator
MGASGYLFKSTPLDEFAAAIRSVTSGKKYVPNQIALGLAIHTMDEPLSLAEFAVLKSVALGNSNQQIARELATTEQPVKSYAKAILSKLDASDRTHAVSIVLS